MKKQFAIILTITTVALLAGCKATFSGSTFQAENLAVDSAIGATHTFNVFYHQSTNNATPQKIDRIESVRDTIYGADRKLAVALSTLESVRQSYDSNPAQSNQVAVATALEAVQSQSSNIVSTVKFFLNQP